MARARRSTLWGAIVGLAWFALSAAAAAADPREDKALLRPAGASSVEQGIPPIACRAGQCTAGKANDGDANQRWASAMSDNQWWQVDLEGVRQVDAVELLWERAYATSYRIETSVDGATFTTAAERTISLSPAEAAAAQASRRLPLQRVEFAARDARFVRVFAISRATRFGFSLWDVGVFGPPDVAAVGAPPFDSSTAAPPASSQPAPSEPAPPVTPRVTLRPLTPEPVVRVKGFLARRGATIQLLSVRVPQGTTIRARCRGTRCPDRVRIKRRVRYVRLAELERSLRAGTVIEIFVTKPGTYGHYTRLVIHDKRAPLRREACVLPGTRRPVRCST